MFNGIVEAVGTIKHIETADGSMHLTIVSPNSFANLFVGESMAVNGVCLTITQFLENEFRVSVVPETIRVTHFSELKLGDLVNLERSMRADSRVSGHYVQGHIDTMGEIIDLQQDGDALLVKISIPSSFTKYIVKKGYIALDGMSITVIDVSLDWFTVTLIPHTQNVTIIKQYTKGSKINIEVDILGKYVEKLLGAHIECNPI